MITRVGLPKGRFEQQSRHVIASVAGSDIFEPGRYAYDVGDVSFFLLKAADCARLTEIGMLHAAVVPDEWIVEFGATLERIAAVCWCHSSVAVLAPTASYESDTRILTEHGRVRVATPFPNLSKRYFASKDLRAEVICAQGSIETFPGRLTDLAVDCVESGSTAAANDSQVLEVVLRSDTWWVRSTGSSPSYGQHLQAAISMTEKDCDWSSHAYF